MKITQLRNATIVIHYKEYVVLVDPMLAPKNAIPALKYVTGKRRRNPLVEMPDNTDDVLSKVTHCLITHCQKGHFDHLDKAGTKWLRENNIPVIAILGDYGFQYTVEDLAVAVELELSSESPLVHTSWISWDPAARSTFTLGS